MTDSHEKSAFDVPLADTDIEIPKQLRPTLDRLDVKTVGQLALLDEYAASKAWGVGTRKLQLIKDLVLKAKVSLGISTDAAKPSSESLPADIRDAPLLFIPSLLVRQFERDGIRTVGDMLSLNCRELDGAAGWGDKKINILSALQNLSTRLYLENDINPEALVSSIVDSCLLHDPRLGEAPVSEFIGGALSKHLPPSAAQTDTEALRRLIASFASTGSRTNAYFGNTAMAQMEWRDVPLKVNTRVESFLDKFNLRTIGELDRVATTGLVHDVTTVDLVLVADQENFGDASLERLRGELEKLAQLGLHQYRSGTICSLEELPRADMLWRDVPLEVPARVETLLDEFSLATIGDVYRFALRAQVACQQSGNWISAIEMKNISERSISELRSELMALAAKGLDGYRYGDAGKPTTASALTKQLSNFLSEREADVLRRRCSGLTLEETAVQIGITRERVRQIESGAWVKCHRFRDAAHEIFLPITHAFEQCGTIDSREAIAAIGASELLTVLIVSQIAGIDIYRVDDQTLTKYSRRQLEGLELLVREALESSSLQLRSSGFSIRTLISHCSDQKKWFVQEWAVVTSQQDLLVSKENMVRLIGVDWLRAHIQSQLVVAGINGVFFHEISTAQIISCVKQLESLMGDTVRHFGNDRFRTSGVMYDKADEIIEILKKADTPLSTQEVIQRSAYSWQQPVIVGRYLTPLYEVIQADRGQYIHIDRLGLTVPEICGIAAWGAELLLGERRQVDGPLLFELYRETNLPQKVENALQLVSIVAKHPDVRRISNNLQLAHTSTFDESELFLAATDPDLALQWHPEKNGKTTPETVRPTSARKYWWVCAVGHEFEASVVYRTRAVRTCPLCQGKWTLTKIRRFVQSLQGHLESLTAAELYVIFQQSGLWQTDGKAKGFVKALGTGRFPKKELKKFVDGEPSLVDEFLNDVEFQLEQFTDDPHDKLPQDSEVMTEVQQESTEELGQRKLPEVRTKNALAALDKVVMASTDAEAAEFLIASAKSKIWGHAYRDEVAAISDAESFTGSIYAEQVRSEFLTEFETARNLQIPTGYSFSIDGEIREPNLMQRHVASQILERRRYGNWSGTGAGKTLSAVLATRVAQAGLTVVCCPNAVVGDESYGWATEILRIFPDSQVITKTLTPAWNESGSTHRYLILNYEQFQQPDSEAKLKRFVESNKVDFIVIDEVHYAKQRYAEEMSQRKRLIQALVSAAGTSNPDLRVLGLSATPVINNLQEGRSLVEMITGIEHHDLDVKPTVANCMRLHQRLATIGTRWRPAYEAELSLETVDVDCSEFLHEIRQLGKIHSPLDLEKILTRARLPAIIKRLIPGKKTLIYTHYVQEIDQILYAAIVDAGFSVGFYTGQSKDGLEAFKQRSLDVLIGSSAIGTGVDGLQHCCNQLIINILPWTNAEYEQLIGRIWRQGQSAERVHVIVPTTFAKVNGERWSYCDSKLNRIQYKKSIADAAVDGAVPEGNLRSPAQAQHDIMTWLERLSSGEETTISRRKIVVPLCDDEVDVRRRHAKYGDFSKMNNRWNQTSSARLTERLSDNPEEWEQYHTFYREARSSWPVIPFQEMIRWCKRREGYTIGDFGCGEALLSKAVCDRHTVYSFDHVAIDETVIEGDMSQTPLDNEILDAAVFSLSLMGSNFTDYLRESHRVLKIDGHLHIWEATSRFTDLDGFCAGLEQLGFRTFKPSQRGQFTHIEAQKTDREPVAGIQVRF